jgi:hypothetical protein
MALAFPLTTAQFQETFRIEELTLDTPGQQEIAQTGAGEVLVRDLGPRLWRGQVTVSNYRFDCGAGIRAKIDVLRRPGASFLFYDPRKPFPAEDPDGRVINAWGSTTQLRSVNANRRDITLGGLPSGYELSPGDYISFTYGTNPVRYAMHQLVTGVKAPASAGATTAAFEVTPPIREGYALNAAVRVTKAVFKAVLVPNTFEGGTLTGLSRNGMTFEFIQTLR